MAISSAAVITTLVRNPTEGKAVRLLIDSIRDFGEALADCPIWLYCPDLALLPEEIQAADRVEIRPLPPTPRYLFADKVAACAHAEAHAATFDTLIWIDPVCLVLQPPTGFLLTPPARATVRPVHIRNVGLSINAPLDTFWRRVYAAVGQEDSSRTMETFIGGETIRAYFNTYAFSAAPREGLMGRWWALFVEIIEDQAYQETACADDLHQIFLHQALFSALMETAVPPGALKLLPPSYNYPYNLQERVPADRRAARMEDLVLVAVEGRSMDPAQIADIALSPSLRSWLAARIR